MNNPEVLIYLVIIILYFIFNYGVNKMLGGDKEKKENQPRPYEPEEDPWDPFGDRREHHSEEDLTGPMRHETTHPNTPEERDDLGQPSTIEPETQSTFPPAREEKYSTPERRVKEQEHAYDEDEYKGTQYKSEKPSIEQAREQANQHKPATSHTRPSERMHGTDALTKSGKPRKKKKRKLQFDPVKAVIYSEILKRPDY